MDNTINITDVDDSNIESATITITNNYVVTEDFLNFFRSKWDYWQF